MPERLTIIDFVEKYTREYASHVFLREKPADHWTETTFEQTRLEAYRVAAGLMSLGINKGDRISLLSEGRNLWVIGELGILYAGAVNVPLSIKLEEGSDLVFRIRHSDSRFVMVSGSQLPKIRRIVSELPALEKIIVFDEIEDRRDNEITMSEVLALGDAFLKEHPGELEARYRSIGPDDYANISYTSGTTADPKGILLTHRNYTANVEQAHSVVAIEPDSVMLIILPLDHCFAHVAGFYTMMSYCGSIATVPVGKTPMAALRNIPMAIKEVRPHVMLSVPALARNFKKNIETAIKAKGPKVEKLYNFALNLAISYNKEYYNRGGILQIWKKPLIALFDKLIFKTVRQNLGGRMQFFIGGGALLDIELQRYYCAIGIPMFQGYGLSEATPIISANSAGHCIFGSSGRVVKPMDIKICDGDGKSLPYGERGEIVVRGENVMAGYWKNPVSTAETVVDGWLHTGDMGYMRDEEFLYVVGRFKSLLISADGEKYSPEGFEDSLTDGSKYIDQVVLHNNQDPYTTVIVVPNKEALKEYVKSSNPGIDIDSREAKELMLKKIQDEVNSYRKGGSRAGMFPERWLPAAIIVADEPFTEQNHMVNSTMKIVRGKVEKHYADRIEYALTPEGKNLLNDKNIASL
ncbi:MAG: AMP-binding protein [Candidatus Cryptobacteroides sp.]|nr:AMP-binding protein [Bacteroidales bacterium]MDY2859562.1 AMP-binding protein [Candidatus Cryptobacteroides sp.]MDY5495817.1 AMP-binding protein [Candidatus Cryptobacteroides sp.]